jgi:uncharacterized YigZ family protein
MKSIKTSVESKYVVEKSEFITILHPIKDSFEAKELIKETRKEYSDATHVVHAYILPNEAHSSDDSEPKGTAGLPTLEVLRKNDLTNVLCLTIRYFGGIKLGEGGLVRAYTKSVTEALSLATFIEEKMIITFTITFDYKNVTFVDKQIRNALEISKTFDDKVNYTISIENEEYPKLLDSLSPLGMNYQITNEIIEKRFL